MRGTIALLIATVAVISCGALPRTSTTSPIANTSPTASPSASPTAFPTASPSPPTNPASIPKLSGVYGLLYSSPDSGSTGILHLVNADASLAASVPMSWNQVGVLCSGRLDGVDNVPPVSATDGHVYFREGETIRMVVPPSSAVDVTKVPDSSSVMSFFSVRPDDQRIAVVVVDVSSPTTVTTRLYVEDLFGGGHHSEIYSASATKGQNPLTLWPMGWHQGNLVLAVVHACIFSLTEPPTEWHVSNATTATRVATIKGSGCVMSTWPSPAGVACADNMGATTLYDWGGKAVAATGPGIVTGPGIQIVGSNTALSPAGKSIFFSNGRVGPGSATRIVQLGPGPYATVQDHAACGWIDEDHLLSTDAVITFHAETPGNLQMTAVVTPLPGSALPAQSTPGSSSCAGRFPGGL